jgi:DNA excision repair protein ERCC-2
MEDLVLIVDECHNLPDNVQSITSDQVSTFSFNRAVREATSNGQKQFVAFLDTCADYLLKMNRKIKFDKEVYIDPAIFLEEIELELRNIDLDEEFFLDMIDMGNAIRNRLAKRGKEPRSSLGRIGEFFFRWFSSIGRSEYTHSFEKKKFSGSNDYFVILRLDSLDPSIGILPVLKNVNCSLHISGTIGDPEAYKMMTGLDRLNSMANILPSPYESKNIKSLIIKELTTQYRQRSSVMWTKMVHAIAAVAKETFVPSYAILRELLNHGLDRWVQKPIIEAESGMSSEDNDKMIKQFKRMADRGGAVLCSVLGGRSSEGSDFPGDLMNSVVVVGIPYAPPNVRVDAQISYLNEKFPGRGRLLSYNIPAINRASQAAGRPVRGLDDRAFILLLDYRFGHNSVNMHLPEWLRTSMELIDYDPDLISSKVRQFFSL